MHASCAGAALSAVQPATERDHRLQRLRRLLAGKQVFYTVDIQQSERRRQLRQTLQTAIGDEERLEVGRQLGQFFQALAIANAQGGQRLRQLADALERRAAIEAELLQAFRQAIHFEQIRRVVRVQTFKTSRQRGKQPEAVAVVEHQALQRGGQTLRQHRQSDGTVEVDRLDSVRQFAACIDEISTTPDRQQLHRRGNRRQMRQPGLLVEADLIGMGRKMLFQCLVRFQI